jgi:hypothetical protein
MATIVRGTGRGAVTQTSTGQDYPAAQAVAITDGDGSVLAFAAGTLPVGYGAGPYTSLNAATATGPGAIADLGAARTVHTLQTSVTGAPSVVTVNLEGSLSPSGPWTTLLTSTSTAGDLQSAPGKAVRYMRANLTTLTGGTTPKVTALIAAGQ